MLKIKWEDVGIAVRTPDRVPSADRTVDSVDGGQFRDKSIVF